MPEAHPGQQSRRGPGARVTWLVIGAVVLTLALSFAWASSGTRGADFAGTDAQAVEAIEQTGVAPWFTPVFAPGSAELEAGLFAAQAALGAGVLGWAIGVLQSRATVRRLRAELARTQGPSPGTDPTGPDPALP